MGQHTHPGLWGRAVRVEVVPNGPLFTSRSPLRTWVRGRWPMGGSDYLERELSPDDSIDD